MTSLLAVLAPCHLPLEIMLFVVMKTVNLYLCVAGVVCLQCINKLSFCLGIGRKTLGPLDFLYYEWKEQRKALWNVSDWIEQLCDRLEVIREVAREKQLRIVDERKRIYDKGKKRREYEVNGLVWCRVPGIDIKLEDAWKGLYKILEKLGEVNYRIVKIGKKRKPRVVHPNTIKAFVERKEIVARVTLATEEDDFEISKAETVLIWADCYSKDKLDQLLDNYQDVLSNKPGLTHLLEMRVQVETEKPIAQPAAYMIPEVIKEKVIKQLRISRRLGLSDIHAVHGYHH